MSTLEAIILGIFQGLTEFFPVSSSGHLTLFQSLFGLKNLNQLIIFDLVCHLGTLLSIACVYRTQLAALLTTQRTRLFQIALGTIPLFPCLLILKQIESLYDQTSLLGFFFLGTATILFIGIRWGSEKTAPELERNAFRDALIVGCSQAAALLPGISRSGTTLSAARLLGWKGEEALSFSFMLAIPAILGGTCLKILQMIFSTPSTSAPIQSLLPYFAGFFSSFLVGTLALWLLIRLAAKQKMMYFVWYCLFLGSTLIIIPLFKS